MLEKFFPDEEVAKIEDISLEDLMQKNIKALIVDIDNTICEWKMEPNDDVRAWIKMMKRNGIQICLVSNNKRFRVEKISRILEINAVHNAAKPSRKAFLSAIGLMGVSYKETAVIGDQIFTDIYGGNRLGLYTIYVRPIALKDYLFVRCKRPFEWIILKKFRTRSLEQRSERDFWKTQCAIKRMGNNR